MELLLVVVGVVGSGVGFMGVRGWMVGGVGLTSNAFLAPRFTQHLVVNLGFAFADSDHRFYADYLVPALLVLALCVYLSWGRARYFGNTAPLLVALLFIGLGMAHPNSAASGFLLAAVPFLFLFVSGVLADLMETSYGRVIGACVAALLITYMARTLLALAQVTRG